MCSFRKLAASWVGFSCFTFVLVGADTRAFAYSPDDPEVRASVARGIAYLEGLSEEELNAKSYGVPEGQPMLIAYAHLKSEGDPSAPLVQLGLKNALSYAKKIRSDKESSRGHGAKSIYEMSVAIMLLAEIDSRTHADDIRFLADSLLSEQMGHGGYGYPGDPHGDTSQVQYVSLAMWTLDRAGFEIDYNRVGRLIAWCVSVQDPTGYWTYQPEYPGPGRGLVKQPTFHLSLTTGLAAGSAVLISADVLRQWGATEGMETKIEGLPKAVKVAVTDETTEQKRNAAKKQAAKVPADTIRASIDRFERWRAQNPFRRTGGADWYYYMLYTMERYESFLELAKPSARGNNAWYDEGVENLLKLQDASGAWGAKDASQTSPGISTAFAILFLIRSTKKSISAASYGTLAGGHGLPDDTAKIVVSGTQVKGEKPAEAVTDLLSLLDEDADELDGKSIPDDLQLETDPKRRRHQLDRLERLVRGSQSWQARRVAAKLLGTSDDLTVVPSLIYALSDPDTVVRRSAVEGLRFISRRFNDFDLPDKPDAQQIRKAQQEWRQWYLSIYPGHVFIDD